MKLMKNLARSLTLSVALGLSATAFNAARRCPSAQKPLLSNCRAP